METERIAEIIGRAAVELLNDLQSGNARDLDAYLVDVAAEDRNSARESLAAAKLLFEVSRGAEESSKIDSNSDVVVGGNST